MFVVIVNESKRSDVTPAWLEGLSRELTRQLQEFCALYGFAAWSVTTDPNLAPVDAPRLVFLPSLDVAGALGYHDKDPQGRPYGRIDCEPGQSLDDMSETASHETMELVGDLEADTFVLTPDGTLRAYEACDAVQGTPYRGEEGYLLANFVTPAWYEPEERGPFDRQGVLRSALSRTDGGYVIIDEGGQVTTDPPMAASKKSRAHETSRLSKRRHHAEAARAKRRASGDGSYRVVDADGRCFAQGKDLHELARTIANLSIIKDMRALPDRRRGEESLKHDGTHEPDEPQSAAVDVCGECGHAAKFHTPKPPHFCGACSCLGFREKPARAASGA